MPVTMPTMVVRLLRPEVARNTVARATLTARFPSRWPDRMKMSEPGRVGPSWAYTTTTTALIGAMTMSHGTNRP